MMHVTIKDKMDKPLWEEIARKSEIEDVFQSYEWAHIMNRVFGYVPKFMLLYQDEEPVGGLLFFEKPILRFFRAYESHGGPLIHSRRRNYFYSIVRSLSEIRNPLYAMVRPSALHQFHHIFVDQKFLPLRMSTVIINLSLPETVLWKQLDRQTRRAVSKAEKMNVGVIDALSKREWDAFYNIYVQHCAEHGIAKNPKEFFDCVYDFLRPIDRAKLFLAIHRNRIIAGSLFLGSKSTIYYYINASTCKARDICANDMLMWYAMKWGCQNKIKNFDLMDLPAWEKDRFQGITNFKIKWGGQTIDRNYYIKGKIFYIIANMTLKNSLVRRTYQILREKI